MAIFNFSDLLQEDYEVNVEGLKDGEVLLYSDWDVFSGKTSKKDKVCTFEAGKIKCTLNPFSAVLVKIL